MLSKKKTPPLLSSIETTHLTVQTSWYPKETLSHFPCPFQINLKNFFFFPFRKTFFTYDIATILFFLAIEIKESYTRKTHGFGQPSNFSFRILSATLFGVTKNGHSLTIGVRAGGARGAAAPTKFGQLRFFGQQGKIWAKPAFKDVSMFFIIIIILKR